MGVSKRPSINSYPPKNIIFQCQCRAVIQLDNTKQYPQQPSHQTPTYIFFFRLIHNQFTHNDGKNTKHDSNKDEQHIISSQHLMSSLRQITYQREKKSSRISFCGRRCSACFRYAFCFLTFLSIYRIIAGF